MRRKLKSRLWQWYCRTNALRAMRVLQRHSGGDLKVVGTTLWLSINYPASSQDYKRVRRASVWIDRWMRASGTDGIVLREPEAFGVADVR